MQEKLANTKKLSEVRFSDYDAIFYVGGHGPVIDLPNDQDNIKLIGEVSRSRKTGTVGCLAYNLWVTTVLELWKNRVSCLPWNCVKYCPL